MVFRQLHIHPAPSSETTPFHLMDVVAKRNNSFAEVASAVPTAPLLEEVAETQANFISADESAIFPKDDELSPREELVFLLHVAAEVEHSLLVQYLYTAYSIVPEQIGNSAVSTAAWRKKIVDVAKEEMGHLLTVQNVLRFIGGPLHFIREHFPYLSVLYPFPFTLQKLTRAVLAKYVFAESPPTVPEQIISKEDQAAIAKLAMGDAQVGVNHVGALYATIIDRLRNFAGPFQTDSALWQTSANDAEWNGLLNDNASNLLGPKVFTATSKETATAALVAVAAQGEGAALTAGSKADDPSVANAHFFRFYSVFKQFPETFKPKSTVSDSANTTDPLPASVTDKQLRAAEEALVVGRISNLVTKKWAKLFNIRYRMLLTALSHALAMPAFVTPDGKPAAAGSPNAAASQRAALIDQVFQQMQDGTASLRALSAVITRLARTDAATNGNAGPPFELPESLDLPDRAVDRWQLHLEFIEASQALLGELAPIPDLFDAPMKAQALAEDLNWKQVVLQAQKTSPF